MRWVDHVAHIVEKRNAYRMLAAKPQRKKKPTDREGDILKLIFKKQCGKTWTGFIWLRTGTGGRFLWTWTFGFYVQDAVTFLNSCGTNCFLRRTPFNGVTWLVSHITSKGQINSFKFSTYYISNSILDWNMIFWMLNWVWQKTSEKREVSVPDRG